MKKTAVIIAVVSFTFASPLTSFAMDHESMPMEHGGMEHGGKHMGEAMAKQHHMMAMYAQIQIKINESLRKSDAKAVETEARKILETIPDLKAAKPHKNFKQHKSLRQIAAAFEADIKKTAAAAKKGDFAGAKTAFAKAEARCDQCHAKFRD